MKNDGEECKYVKHGNVKFSRQKQQLLYLLYICAAKLVKALSLDNAIIIRLIITLDTTLVFCKNKSFTTYIHKNN